MDSVTRIGVVLVGAFMAFMGLTFWFVLDSAGPDFGYGPDGLIGRANVRADVGGFFIGLGLMALFAAWKRDATSVTCAALLMGLALAARLLSIFLDGPAPGGMSPMIAEGVMLAILLWARSKWLVKA